MILKGEILKSRLVIYLLLLCMAGNTAHMVSHFHQGLHLFSHDTSISQDESSTQSPASVNAEHDCLACQSFQHSPTITQSIWLALVPPAPVVTLDQIALLPVTAILAKSHGERGPPQS